MNPTAGQTAPTLKTRVCPTLLDRQDGEDWRSSEKYEPRQGSLGAPNPVGEDGSGIADVVPPIPDDETVRRSEIEKRVLANPKDRLRPSAPTHDLLCLP